MKAKPMTEITDELRGRALAIIPARVLEYEDKPFVIVEGWEELSRINEALNGVLASLVFKEWAPIYCLTASRQEQFSDLRLGHRRMPDGGVQRSADLYRDDVKPPYTVPEGLIELGDVCDWGFSDEYGTCDTCERVVRTMPDCYSWTPDYWDSGDGYVCGSCVCEEPDDYLEDRIERGLEGKTVTCNLIDPGEYGFGLVAYNLEHGLHEHQNDDPRKIARWAKESALQVVFTVSSGQFTRAFDVWVRHEDGSCLDDDRFARVKEALIESETEHSSCLRKEFRQYPTPADLMKQSLKAASAAGEKFVEHHGDGTYTAYETAEEMCESY